ncbi:MAG: UbiD family decarboxylase [Planctomycetia bacterium]|nr:UbiD family decarboxylase [Planctomycetia bacterium]
MSYRTLRDCVEDLSRTKQLVRIDEPIDANLEVGAIQRRVFESGGPALLFTNIKGCRFPMLGNIFGTMERIHYIFRDSIDLLRRALRLGVDPTDVMRRPGLYLSWKTPLAGWCSRPKWVRHAPVLKNECRLEDLPQLKSWPKDGGAYITLPQVYSEEPENPGVMRSNLGMYRVQISGNDYAPNEAGLHYQIHRGIGIHHAQALARGENLRVNVFVGGPPAMSIAAVMPLPEGMSELLFAGILNRRRVGMKRVEGFAPILAEADFCLCGYLDSRLLKREGPFGDHLGYYSLGHDFPVLRVEKVYHRQDAIWPFTTVGRPPQEDSMIGAFIHEISGEIIPHTLPGVKEVHAVDDCGVHPLLLALGSERYTPYLNVRRPQELLTLSHAILGTGQLSLAKYLFIAAAEDDPTLRAAETERFFAHILRRVDWARDLHFQTNTTMDTLDYTGGELNSGSKVVVSAVGAPRRTLPTELPSGFSFPSDLAIKRCTIPIPGVLALEIDLEADRFCGFFSESHPINAFPLVVLVDDARKTSASLRDFLWTIFTKSDPAQDIHGIAPFVHNKHWGCRGSLVIDARNKPFHAPELEEDPQIAERADACLRKWGLL